MTTLYRRIPRLGVRAPFEVPDRWRVSAYEENPRRVVNCAGCGRPVPFRFTTPSKTIRSEEGFGYALCSDCMFYEMEEEDLCDLERG